jgi:hypothetical protein
MQGDTAYSRNVKNYTQAYAESLELTPELQVAADAAARYAMLAFVVMLFAVAVGGWGVLWLLSWVIGWIVRGFTGIPRGRDSQGPPQRLSARRADTPPRLQPEPPTEADEAMGNEDMPGLPTSPVPVGSRVQRPTARRALITPDAPELKNAGLIAGWLVLPLLGLLYGFAQFAIQAGGAIQRGALGLVAFDAFWMVYYVIAGAAFFARHRWTPALFIGLQVLNVVLVGSVVLVAASSGQASEESFGLLFATLVTAGVWIPYFLVSKRVKVTFVR